MEEPGFPVGVDFCILGYPVSRSASPPMYNRFFEKRGLPYSYGVCELPSDGRLGEFVEWSRRRLRGFNVTIPYKESIMPLVDQVDEVALDIGAVNTVAVRGGRLYATNTDWRGFVEPLINIAGGLEKEKAVILGAGGAARAAAYALVEGKLSCDIHVLGRSWERMRGFRDHARSRGWGECLSFDTMSDAVLRRLIPSAGLVVNATPLGSYQYPDATPFPAELIRGDMVVYEMVYNPVVTRLLKAALERGARVVDGVCMLATQARENLRFWLGVDADVFELRKNALDFLEGAGSGGG